MNKLPDETDNHASSEAAERDDAVIGTALRWSAGMLILLATAVGGALWWWNRPGEGAVVTETVLTETRVRESPPVVLPQVPFTDITDEAGIAFTHENGAYGDKLLPETMGGGCAFLDYDGDGDQDLLLINSQRWPWDPRPATPPAKSALYQNDGTGRFVDVSAGSGLDVSLVGMGAAVGDYDHDGDVDVFISTVGPDRLFRNEGQGRFVDVTAQAGVAGPEDDWSTGCGWFDYDNDGDLDLFVCTYVQWSREYDLAQDFQLTGGGRSYGRPQDFEGTFSKLYRNQGNGRFADVSQSAGVQVVNSLTDVPMGKSLGVVFADFDQDGWIDIAVANDTIQNFLLHNLGNGTFEETGLYAGIAFDMAGAARGAMGIDAARFRNNDALGLAVGNFANEASALYVTRGSTMRFVDEAIATGLGPATRPVLTFGLFYIDCDLDGRLDLFAANGHLESEINRVQPSQYYEQPPQLFWNAGAEYGTEFCSMGEAQCGPDLFRRMVGRGAAYADIDGDGDQDILIMASGQAPRLLRNDQQTRHNWLRFRLEGTQANRDAIGTWVTVQTGDRTLRQQVMPTRSYLSQVELPVTFGLGTATEVRSVEITWPDGSRQAFDPPKVNQTITIRQSDTTADVAR